MCKSDKLNKTNKIIKSMKLKEIVDQFSFGLFLFHNLVTYLNCAAI